jgi:hypothetical protein
LHAQIGQRPAGRRRQDAAVGANVQRSELVRSVDDETRLSLWLACSGNEEVDRVAGKDWAAEVLGGGPMGEGRAELERQALRTRPGDLSL